MQGVWKTRNAGTPERPELWNAKRTKKISYTPRQPWRNITANARNAAIALSQYYDHCRNITTKGIRRSSVRRRHITALEAHALITRSYRAWEYVNFELRFSSRNNGV